MGQQAALEDCICQLRHICKFVFNETVRVFRVNNYIKIKFEPFAKFCSMSFDFVFRTCNRNELAGENNDCFAMMRLQFKILGTRSGPAPSLSPFAPVTDWMRPSTPLKTLRRDALSSNTSARRHYSGLQGCNPTEVGHGHGHIHEPH